MSDLKGTLEFFARSFFGPESALQWRPHHFPFTEPSLELELACVVCRGSGCSVCRYSGWLELLGQRHGASPGAAQRRGRPRALLGLRLRHGHRARGDARVGHPRHAPALRQRRPLPRPRGGQAGSPGIRRHEVLAALAARLRDPRRARRQRSSRRWSTPAPRWARVEIGGEGIVVARITAVAPVPGSSHLQFADLDLGGHVPAVARRVQRRTRNGPGLDRGAERQGRRPRALRAAGHPPAGDGRRDWASRRSADTSHRGCSARRSSSGSGDDADGILILEEGTPGQALGEVLDPRHRPRPRHHHEPAGLPLPRRHRARAGGRARREPQRAAGRRARRAALGDLGRTCALRSGSRTRRAVRGSRPG